MANEPSGAVPDFSLLEAGLPETWKHGTKELYEATFILPPYNDHLVRLVALPADDILCINIFVSNVSHGNVYLKSLALSSSGFVPRCVVGFFVRRNDNVLFFFFVFQARSKASAVQILRFGIYLPVLENCSHLADSLCHPDHKGSNQWELDGPVR